MLSGLTSSMAITIISLGVAVSPEVNMAAKKAEVLMYNGMFYIRTLQMGELSCVKMAEPIEMPFIYNYTPSLHSDVIMLYLVP